MSMDEIMMRVEDFGGESRGEISKDTVAVEFPADSTTLHHFEAWCEQNGVGCLVNGNWYIVGDTSDCKWLV